MLHFGSKLHSIIDKDYELIRKCKTTTVELHDSHVDLSEKLPFLQRHGTLEQNQKVMMQHKKSSK